MTPATTTSVAPESAVSHETRPPVTPPPARRAKRRKKTAHRIRIIAGVLVCILFLLPVFWMILTSFKLPRDIFTTPPTLFTAPTLDNYANLGNYDIPRRMLNTVIVSLGAGLLSVWVGSMAGYAIARLKIKGGGMIGALILATRGVPPIALAVPLFLVARNLGMTDRHLTLILAYSTFLIPYVMWLMRSFFLSIPKELEESAMVDGASRLGAFYRIIVPILTPALASSLIFSVMMAYEELLFALVLTNRNASTIPVAIQGMAVDTESGGMWGLLTAAGTITVVPVVILTLVLQKYLISGLTDGATKG